jgi:hypothetical protein
MTANEEAALRRIAADLQKIAAIQQETLQMLDRYEAALDGPKRAQLRLVDGGAR